MKNVLLYKTEAADWTNALPVGNGRLGAMVFSSVKEELIQLNEDSLWSGYPTEWFNENAYPNLEVARKKIKHGYISEGQKVVEENMAGKWTQSYLPLGDLSLQFDNDGVAENYKRELNLETAIIANEYSINNSRISRECFISPIDDLLIYKITCDKPISFIIKITSQLQHNNTVKDGTLILMGQAPNFVSPHYIDTKNPIVYGVKNEEKGMRFCALIKPVIIDGELKYGDNEIHVINTQSAIIYVACETSFNGHDRHPYIYGKNEIVLAQQKLKKATDRRFYSIKKEHIKSHQELFNRVDFEIEPEDKTHLNTDDRIRLIRQGKDDLGFIPLLLQYGRYLLISCSREGSNAANLQGIWNKELRAYWSCNYTTNINVEMNYWHAEVCNLSECHIPLIELIKNTVVNGEKVARKHYNCDGWVAHHNLDIWATGLPAGDNGKSLPGWAACLFWPMGGVWLCHHLWEHYDFTRDKVFLKNVAYPIMLNAAKFCLDWLVESDEGLLVTMPSTAPENCYYNDLGEVCAVDIGTTMDISLIYDLFSNCIECIDILDEDSLIREKLQNSILKLPSLKKGKHGELLEWSKNYEEPSIDHRHISHLYGLYPGNRISEIENTEYLDACKKTIERRLSTGIDSGGWSIGWQVCLFARLKDHDLGVKAINRFITKSIYDNLFDLHPPLSSSEKEVFQIDGNFGVAAGIAEMLIQSHCGYIEILPCLPMQWHSGYVNGLKARGGYECSIRWKNGNLVTFKISTVNSGNCLIKYKNKKASVELQIGCCCILDFNLDLIDREP